MSRSDQSDLLRNQILSEIRRVAALVGKAPGRRTFESQTGIRESEWRGVVWARWGDALREAGLEANQRQSKLDEGGLLEQVAQAVRHYRKFPTTIELRMYGRNNPNFPAHSTLENHFRTKSQLLEKLKIWVADHPEYSDIAILLPRDNDFVPEPRVSAATEGLVYLLKSGSFYKIGRSSELERRVKEIRVALPEAATLVHTIRTDDPSGIEAYWHRRFESKRANGEWFKLSVADVLAFKRRTYQ